MFSLRFCSYFYRRRFWKTKNKNALSRTPSSQEKYLKHYYIRISRKKIFSFLPLLFFHLKSKGWVWRKLRKIYDYFSFVKISSSVVHFFYVIPIITSFLLFCVAFPPRSLQLFCCSKGCKKNVKRMMMKNS